MQISLGQLRPVVGPRLLIAEQENRAGEPFIDERGGHAVAAMSGSDDHYVVVRSHRFDTAFQAVVMIGGRVPPEPSPRFRR